MAPSLRALLVGSPRNASRWYLYVILAASLFVAVFSAYALDVFDVSGGVVWLAGDAAVVGALCAVLLAYRASGLVFAWLAVYGSLLGYHADHYFLGLSGRSLGEKVAAFVRLDGLLFVAVEALVLATLAWTVGTIARRAVETVQNRRNPTNTR